MFILLTFALAVLGVMLADYRFKDSLAPVGVFSVIWFSALSLFAMPIVDYITIEFRTWLILLGAGVMFIFGAIIIKPPQSAEALSRHNAAPHAEEGAIMRSLYVVLIISLLGMALFYYRVHSILGISVIWEDPRLLHYHRVYGELAKTGIVGVFYATNILLLPLLAYYYARFGRLRPIMWFILLYLVAFFFVESSRTATLATLSWAAFAWFYLNSRNNTLARWAIISAAGLTIISLFILGQVRLEKGAAASGSYVMEYAALGDDTAVQFIDGYVYATGSFAAFDVLVDRADFYGYSWGFETFAPVARMINLILPRTVYAESVREFVYIPFPYNTFTFLDAFYLDFGWVGALLGPFALGALSQAAYRMARERSSFLSVLTASWFTSLLVSTISVNRFTWVVSWYFLVLCMALHLAFFRQNSPAPPSASAGPLVTPTR